MVSLNSWFYTSLVILAAFYPAPEAAKIAAVPERYHEYSCPQVTSMISDMVGKMLATNRSLAGVLNRLHIYDCWVRVRQHTYIHLERLTLSVTVL
ncbi:hypothetical protein Mapa_001238 [Marchantia paleacea]|nr:hypothetical protein Mapa_001238 [Marchantia paleacea]